MIARKPVLLSIPSATAVDAKKKFCTSEIGRQLTSGLFRALTNPKMSSPQPGHFALPHLQTHPHTIYGHSISHQPTSTPSPKHTLLLWPQTRSAAFSTSMVPWAHRSILPLERSKGCRWASGGQYVGRCNRWAFCRRWWTSGANRRVVGSGQVVG